MAYIIEDGTGYFLTTDADELLTGDDVTSQLVLFDPVLDSGLSLLNTATTHLELCTDQPTSYAELATYGLASITCAFGAPAAATGGRKAAATFASRITIATAGTAAWWAVSDHPGSRVLAAGALTAAEATLVGEVWSLPAFEIRMPSS